MNTLCFIPLLGAQWLSHWFQDPAIGGLIAGQALNALLRSSILLAVAWAAYRYLLRNTRWFGLNRAVLLGIVLGSAVVPWLPLQRWSAGLLAVLSGGATPASENTLASGEGLLSSLVLPTVEVGSATAAGWPQALLLLWLLGVSFFAGLFLRDLSRVFARQG